MSAGRPLVWGIFGDEVALAWRTNFRTGKSEICPGTASYDGKRFIDKNARWRTARSARGQRDFLACRSIETWITHRCLLSITKIMPIWQWNGFQARTVSQMNHEVHCECARTIRKVVLCERVQQAGCDSTCILPVNLPTEGVPSEFDIHVRSATASRLVTVTFWGSTEG
jgi:hypothetical protein